MGILPDSGSSSAGRVTVTLRKLGGSDGGMPVTLDSDASIGQLLARMKPLLQEEVMQLYQKRGVIVLCGGDKPASWRLDDSYTKFMACPSVQERIKAGVGLHFNLHLEDVHSNQGWPCQQGVRLEVRRARPHLKAPRGFEPAPAMPGQERMMMAKRINALNLEPSSTSIDEASRQELRSRRHLGPGGKQPVPHHGTVTKRDFLVDLARIDQKLVRSRSVELVISRSVEALHRALDKEDKAERRTLHPGRGSAAPSTEQETEGQCVGVCGDGF